MREVEGKFKAQQINVTRKHRDPSIRLPLATPSRKARRPPLSSSGVGLHSIFKSITKSPIISIPYLRPSLKPFRLHWFPALSSTSDHAAKLRREGKLYAPAIVLAGRQSAGRGRGTNTWWSDQRGGALTVTFALPIHERLAPQELPLIAGLAVRDAVAALAGNAQIQLKWPNDVVHDGRKLAGLLCERVSKVDLVGIGLNVNIDPAEAPANLRDRITSLLCIAGSRFDMNDVLIVLARHLNLLLRLRMEQPFSTFVRQYEHHDALVGKPILVVPAGAENPIAGRCEGVDNAGRLLVRSRENRGTLHRIIAGHVVPEIPRQTQTNLKAKVARRARGR
jgi:BirA family biotin operon repressor/biotin-[acetyl-CoA-carboxylase] ligase